MMGHCLKYKDVMMKASALSDPPTATNCEPDHITEVKKILFGEIRSIHVIPSGDVRM